MAKMSFKSFLWTSCAVVLMAQVMECADEYCLRCDMASSIDDCNDVVKCDSEQYCYTDEEIHSGAIVYNAGCRPKATCFSHRGKRQQVDNLVACSKCCVGSGRNATKPCNTDLCGLPGTAAKGTQGLAKCYSCDYVHNLEDCTGITTCQHDQICAAETHVSTTGGQGNGTHKYFLGCVRKDICIAGTRLILQYRASGEIGVGKRGAGTDLTACKACCGGSYCNTGDCKGLMDKLYVLYQNKRLDMSTLNYIP